MKVYCGTDIIEVNRIQKAILKESGFKTSVYTKNEINDIEKTKSQNMMYQRFAGRFAAKEAIYKALSNIIENEEIKVNFLDFEILNDEAVSRRPYVNILSSDFNKNKISIDISISHIKDLALATCVVTKEE